MSRPARRTAGRAGGCSPAAARSEAVFPPKNETEQRKPATPTDKGKGKTKGKAAPLPPNTPGKLGSWQCGGLGQGARAARVWWGCGAARGSGWGFSPPPAQRCPGRGRGTSQQTRASGCDCCWGLCVSVPKASSDCSSPPGFVQPPAAPPPWHPLRWEHKQHLPSPLVLPSNMLRALQAPERSLQDT